MIIAAVEGGGTTFKVAICKIDNNNIDSSHTILHRISVPSEDDPITCLTKCATFLKENRPVGDGYSGLGIATFGPVGVKIEDPNTYGRILHSSPKRTWRNVNILSPLQEACGNCPAFIETDVNAPAYSEYEEAKKEDNNSKIKSCAYITVGTGVGVGLVVNGQTVHGYMHPEGGHIPIPPYDKDDDFIGYSWGQNDDSKCPFSGINTVEGMTSSIALTERWQQILEKKSGNKKVVELDRNCLKNLPNDCIIWDYSAHALASLCTSLLLTLSIEKIVLGGGVMSRGDILLQKIQKRTAILLNGYLDLGCNGDTEKALQNIIITSKHGDDAGLVGAIVLAKRAALEQKEKVKNPVAVEEEEDEATKNSIVEKQEAFRQGLWHGFIVGVVSTALIYKYGLLGRSSSSSRR